MVLREEIRFSLSICDFIPMRREIKVTKEVLSKLVSGMLHLTLGTSATEMML